MYNRELLLHILHQTEEALGKILTRFEPVDSVTYFTDTPEGMEKLDSICMLLIATGESLKNIDKITDRQLLYCPVTRRSIGRVQRGCVTSFRIIISTLMQKKFSGYASTR